MEETKKRSKLFSMFLEEVPDNSVNAPTPTSTAPSVTVSQAPVAQTDPGVYKQLLDEIEKNNMPGYDYYEFRGSIENMKAHIPGEPERYKAAYAAVASMVKPMDLISSIDFYLEKLEDQRKDFESFSSSMTTEKVTARETEVKKIDDRVNKIQEQIAVLTKEISDLQTQKVSLVSSASQERAKIDSVKSTYDITYQSLVNSILQDKQKIQTYIVGSSK